MARTETRPPSIRDAAVWPRQDGYPSPVDWRSEVLYFFLPDRFSDGRETAANLLDRGDLEQVRGAAWNWERWAYSGAMRFQGGTLAGAASKLEYLEQLGVTSMWVGPVWKQRLHLDDYHGYKVQDFLDIDPRFGTRTDLVELVAQAHARGIRVILDVLVNHTAENWLYPPDSPGGPLRPDYRGVDEIPYAFGSWLDRDGTPTDTIRTDDDAVWPVELQDPEHYTRAGYGNLSAGEMDDPNAEFRRCDHLDRNLATDQPDVLDDLIRCWEYWIALTDCDGFRIDTLKHIGLDDARVFCGAVKEFAAGMGKDNFLLVGEVGGGDNFEDRYLDVLGTNLNAVLDIGDLRPRLRQLARGSEGPTGYFDGFDVHSAGMGSHRALGSHHVSLLDDHDNLSVENKHRFSADSTCPHQVVVGVAIQLFTLGIPCIYYGAEQGFAGPENAAERDLPDWNGGEYADRYLREAMFGPQHPRASGRAGVVDLDVDLPGFGPFGTAGHHCFDADHPIFRRIAALTSARHHHPTSRNGRQYVRETSLFGGPFVLPGGGELVAWSRINAGVEMLLAVNPNGQQARGADVRVDPGLNPEGSALTVVCSTPEVVGLPGPRARDRPEVHVRDGTHFVEIRDLGPGEVLALTNSPEP